MALQNYNTANFGRDI